MNLDKMKEDVYNANMALVKHSMIIFTWGNVSAIDRENNLIVIKPSGIDYAIMQPSDMVVVDLDGNKIEGSLNPSSDTPTHVQLYKSFMDIGGITHTHSTYATTFAQAGCMIKCFGTTHADYFYGDIPCTRALEDAEIESNYEINTGKVIIETFNKKKIDPMQMSAVLVFNHGPFTWGKDAIDSVHNAVVLEEISKMALGTIALSPDYDGVSDKIRAKHYFRKHGKNAYYGQATSKL